MMDSTSYHVLRVCVDGDEDPRRGGEQHRHHEQTPTNPKENRRFNGVVLSYASHTYGNIIPALENAALDTDTLK